MASSASKAAIDHPIRYRRVIGHALIAAGALAVLLFLSAPGAHGLDKTVVLGGAEQWNSIATADGAVVETDAAGNQVLALSADQYTPTNQTDLLLHFNNAPPTDASGNYRVVSSLISVSHRWARIGSGAGVFQGENPALVLTPASDGALFSPGARWQDFTIEFWMYAANLSDGQAILLWQGARQQGTELIPQQVECDIVGGKLSWSFRNFFVPPDGSRFTLSLNGSSDIVPREWHHYTLRFDSGTGMVEQLVDGSPDAIVYANDSGAENGTAFLPAAGTGSLSRIEIGAGFVGFLDELRVSTSFVENPNMHQYRLTAGSAITLPIDLGYTDSPLTSVTATAATPGNTGVFYYYRIANVLSSPDSLPGSWVQFAPGTPLIGSPRGRYVQFKFELLPDGTGNSTPQVSSLTFTYTPHLPPAPPAYLTAAPGNGSVTLSWRKVIGSDLKGYRIYYGGQPGNYFGSGSTAGSSPIDVGNVTTFKVDGLTNGQLYYFAVVAYDSSTPPHLSGFSNEVAARPSTIAGAGP
ncbi:MAG TPA: LamG-like jellyroll fold domain-containing protein [Spirochaetia bacterium]|nr:LamG-like jellyroll fold domain-containing protein [Spirochaetia bacterium]